MKTIVIALFALTYILMLSVPKYRHFTALTVAGIYVVMGVVAAPEALAAVDWNVILMLAGTMGTVYLCIESQMPAAAADILVNKLTTYFFEKEEEIVPLFEKQLEICGVDYFDFYLLHAQNAKFFAKYKRCRAYEHAFQFKKEIVIPFLIIEFTKDNINRLRFSSKRKSTQLRTL